MQKVNWLLIGTISFVMLLIVFGTGVLLGDPGPGGLGTMGPIGMMENWDYSTPPTPLSWVGMVFMSLIPVGLFVLAVFGILWLVRNVSHAKPPTS